MLRKRKDRKKKDFSFDLKSQKKLPSASLESVFLEASRLEKYQSVLNQSVMPVQHYALDPVTLLSFYSDKKPLLPNSSKPWERVMHYQEWMTGLPPEQHLFFQRGIVQSLMKKAHALVGALSRGNHQKKSLPFSERSGVGETTEIDLETTLEESFRVLSLIDPWVEIFEKSPQAFVLCLDRSLSIHGEKMALAALVIAVFLVQFQDDWLGIVAFESKPHVLKRPTEKKTVSSILTHFLEMPTEGFTHLEAGMKAALDLAQELSPGGRKVSTLLITDGQYTLGKNPVYLAPWFHQLMVIHTAGQEKGKTLCQDCAKKGHGRFYPLSDWNRLPLLICQILKELRLL